MTSGFTLSEVEPIADGDGDESSLDLILAAIKRTIHAENMDVPTGGTQ